MHSPSRVAFLICITPLLFACNDTQLVSLPPPPGNVEVPVAVVDGPVELNTLETAVLDGSASFDPDNPADNAIAEYHWALAQAPAGSSTHVQGSGAQGSVFIDVAGQYTVELVVVDRAGLVSEPAYHTFEAVPWADLHVELSWSTNDSDVDVHLIDESRGGSLFNVPHDCYFQNMTPDWGPSGPIGNPTLDIDDVDGFGPENINVGAPEDGQTYRIIVHYWDDWGTGPTDAVVRIYIDGALVLERQRNLPYTDRIWDVARIQWPTGTVEELGTMYDY